MPEIRVQDEQGNIHVFPDGSTPEMIAKAMNVQVSSGQHLSQEVRGPALRPMESTGVTGSLARTGKGLVHLPGSIYDAFSKPPQNDAEYSAIGAKQGDQIDPRAMITLGLKRLFKDPLDAQYEQGRSLQGQAALSRMEGQKTAADYADHLANMHYIASMVPVAGPMAADISGRILKGDVSGGATDLGTLVAGPKIAEGALKAVPQIAKAGATAAGKGIETASDFIENAAARNPEVAQGIIKLLEPRKSAIQFLKSAASKGVKSAEQAQAEAESAAQAVPAGEAPPVPENVTPSTLPRIPSGEGVLNQALTALDNKTLLKIARSRGINVAKEAQLKPGAANDSIIKKIIDDFSPDELEEAANRGLEASLHKPVPGPEVGPDAGAEAWRYKVLNTYFPDVNIPKTMAARAQATIAKRPPSIREQAFYAQAGEQGGHAGGGVSSVEELNRPGANYIVSKSGQLTYHGKSFAPESTPPGATHVTALPDGTFRVNAGPQLNPAQEMALKNAVPSTDWSLENMARQIKINQMKKAAKAGD